MTIDLRATRETHFDIESLLAEHAVILRAYREQDSGCASCVVEPGNRRLSVKAAITPAGAESMARAAALHAAVHHPALPPLLNAFRAPEGPVHVYDWVPGEVLYDYVTMDGERGRNGPASAHARFRTLIVRRILDSLDVIYGLHEQIASLGFLAVDFYDGCILYDFDRHRTSVCDIDEYRPGPFVLGADRLPGSRRFMAPEESERGATIDQRTNVYTLARTAAVLLSDGDLGSDAWRGSDAMRKVLIQAASPERDARFPSVAEFVATWDAAAIPFRDAV